jgi:hypothetical protein
MALPGWNSPEFVRSAHEALEGTAILFFAALVVLDIIAHFETPRHKLFERIGLICFGVAVLMEIFAYPYGHRNDFFADEEIGTLNEEAADAREINGQLEKDAADMRKRAEDEAAARLDIEERVEWRRLPQEKLAEFAITIKRFAGQQFIISADSIDVEGNLFASDLVKALKAALWVYPPIHTVGGAGSTITSPDMPPDTGVEILSPNVRRNAADALARALNGFGFDSHVRDRPWEDTATRLWIMVHVRPFGPQGEAKLRHTAEAKTQK